MAFFEDLGRKINSVGHSAVQKTKDLTDIVKINSEISDEEKRIQGIYNSIGKLYYTKHNNDFEPCFSEMFNALNESLKKISFLKLKLEDIKGVIKCENCGASIVVGAAFCSSCGAPAKKEEKESTNTNYSQDEQSNIKSEIEPTNKQCSSCKAQLSTDAVFCTQCGTKL